MYEKFPFFRTLIDNLQMALAKADLADCEGICGHDRGSTIRDRIFTQIEEEYELTSELILANYGAGGNFG